MAPKDSTALRQILDSQIELTTTVNLMNERLFGPQGAIPVLFHKHDELKDALQGVKDDAANKVAKLKETEIKTLEVSITELKTDAAVSRWRTGAISGLSGSAVGVGITYLIKRLMGVHS